MTRTTDQVTRESVPHMLYLGRDGTLLIVQCASRDGSRTGGWAFTVRRDDWAFPADFLQGWWSVDSEPTVGPLDWGGVGVMVLLNDDALKARLEQPVRERIVLTVAQGTRRWELLFRPNDLDQAVAEFGPVCRAT